VLFDDGDVEVRPAAEVVLLKYRAQSNVPLLRVYEECADPNHHRRVSRPPCSLVSPDYITDLNSAITDTDSESESETDFVPSSSFESTNVASRGAAAALDSQPEHTDVIESAEVRDVLRRAAAHMVLLAGPALRIEHDACALSLYFCPLSAHAMHAQWGADECAAVRGRVHTAMKQLLLERLPLASLGPAIDAAAYAHRPPHGTLSAAAADKLLQRVASNILPIHPARSSGIPQETQTERCGRVVSAFMDTYETAIGLRGPSRDSIPVKAAHEWWADLNRMRALDSIEEPEKRHLRHIVQAY
jgi:hypothetical protein